MDIKGKVAIVSGAAAGIGRACAVALAEAGAKGVAIADIDDAGMEETARLVEADIDFVIEPTVRFRGKPGEQATMFLRDPSGNALEFKAFADPAQLFAT